MGLNIASQGGDFDPYCKYNAKSGRWFAKQGEQEVEISNPTFVADFANIKTGWFYFKAGQAPEKVFDPSLSEAAPKPQRTYVDDNGKTRDCFSRGFEMRLFSKASFGGEGVVVISGSSMHLNNAISELYEQYEKEAGSHAGELPVVQCTGAAPMKDKFGTNYKPTFVITKWAKRPAELDGASGGNDTAPTPQPKAAAPVAQTVSEF